MGDKKFTKREIEEFARKFSECISRFPTKKAKESFMSLKEKIEEGEEVEYVAEFQFPTKVIKNSAPSESSSE